MHLFRNWHERGYSALLGVGSLTAAGVCFLLFWGILHFFERGHLYVSPFMPVGVLALAAYAYLGILMVMMAAFTPVFVGLGLYCLMDGIFNLDHHKRQPV